MIALWLALSVAHASGTHVVLAGETAESIARMVGDPKLADAIRAENDIAPGAQPVVGSVLRLPESVPGSGCEPSRVLDHNGPLFLRTTRREAVTVTHAEGTLSQESRDVIVRAPVEDHTVLNLADEICTGAAGVDGDSVDGFARVELSVPPDAGARDVITLLPGTCVIITAVDRVRDARSSLVDLTQGAIVVEHQPVPGDVIVRTGGTDPAGSAVTVGHRGGFRVAVEPTSARTEAIGAEVSTTAQGHEVVLPEGYGGRTTFGEAPSDPHPLPTTPKLLSPADRAPLLVPDFRAQPALRAGSYILRIGLAETPQLPVFATELLTPSFAPLYPDETLVLPSGRGAWTWQMSAVDALGFEGKPSPGRTFFAPVVTP